MRTAVLALLIAAAQFRAASITEIDFRNFVYPSFAGLQSVHLRDGDYCSQPGRETCVTLAPVVFGDITGDGQPEAAITLGAVFRFGNGSHTTGLVYTLRDGQPKLIGRFAGGDRGDGGIGKVEIRSRRLIVTRGDGCPACTDTIEQDVFTWSGRHLVLESSSVIRTPRKKGAT